MNWCYAIRFGKRWENIYKYGNFVDGKLSGVKKKFHEWHEYFSCWSRYLNESQEKGEQCRVRFFDLAGWEECFSILGVDRYKVRGLLWQSAGRYGSYSGNLSGKNNRRWCWTRGRGGRCCCLCWTQVVCPVGIEIVNWNWQYRPGKYSSIPRNFWCIRINPDSGRSLAKRGTVSRRCGWSV